MTTSIFFDRWALHLALDISAAQRSVIMTALSLLPPRTLKPDDFSGVWLALAAAVRRGVAVQMALPSPTVAHPATLRNDAAAAALRDIGAVPIMVPPINLLHAKTVSIDSRIAWVGSGNFTAAAAHHNRECWSRTHEPSAVAELAGFHARCFDAAGFKS